MVPGGPSTERAVMPSEWTGAESADQVKVTYRQSAESHDLSEVKVSATPRVTGRTGDLAMTPLDVDTLSAAGRG